MNTNKSCWLGAAILVLFTSAAIADSDTDQVYVVPGDIAWEVASQSGFTFKIQYGMCFDDRDDAKCVGNDGYSREPHDGYKNQLGLARYNAGSMIVERFATYNRNPRSYVFEVFGGKELGDGWEIKDVELLGNYIVEEMEFRTDGPDEDAMFKLRIHESRKEQNSASIKSMTLLGPPAADWRDAFRTGED